LDERDARDLLGRTDEAMSEGTTVAGTAFFIALLVKYRSSFVNTFDRGAEES
jgi:hypothetical protein